MATESTAARGVTQVSGFEEGMSPRELSLLAMLATLWAIVEIQLGNSLHWAHLPFTGVLLTGCGLFVLVMACSFVPRRGTVLSVGLVVAVLKTGTGGAGALFASIGIFVESLFVELILSGPGLSGPRAALAGAAAMSWSIVHPFLTQGILAGAGILRVYLNLLHRAAALFNLGEERGWILIAAVWMLHAVLGAGSGLLAWRFTRRFRGVWNFTSVRSKQLQGGRLQCSQHGS